MRLIYQAERLFNLVRRNLTHRHYQEIHVEAIINDLVYANLLCYAQRHPTTTMFMLSGPNEPWIKARLQAEDFTDKIYESILAERYKALASETVLVGIHVHLFHPKSVAVPNFDWQLKKIRTTKKFIENLGLPTEDFAPGWWGFNEDTVKACCTLGIKKFHCDRVPTVKKHLKIKMEFVEVWRSCDDFQLTAERL